MESEKSILTRRQFGRTALTLSAAAAFPGLLGASERHAKEEAANKSVTGADSLSAHAAARDLLYGAAVVPECP